ncbi:hypothetical protein SO694_00135075 [Aureococcus anophagefferens]|uniref:Uncharacterized protein n=1 Tax=Aureococcus anophagefferens TaxID=44056 RepID=A0ABR1GFL7_AURAN
MPRAARGGRAPVVTVLRARAPSAQFWIRAKCAQERSKARSAWMPLKDPSEPVGPGDLVEMVDKKISRVVTGRGRCFVVSTAPILTGNVPDDETLATGRAVAMIGQVPVKVVGAVRESQCLAPSGRDDGTAAATDAATGISSMETVAAAGESVRLVTALVNAGSHALSKTQKRREARKKKKSESFVVVGDDDADATSGVATDLESAASTHACVQQLIDEKRALAEQLGAISEQNRAFARRMRVLHAVARTALATALRHKLLGAVVRFQERLPAPRARGAVVVQALHKKREQARVVCRATTVVGKLLHKTRRQAAALAMMERELKSAVHASLCPATTATHGLAVPSKRASALSWLTSAVTKICKSGKTLVATAFTKDLKVEIHGKTSSGAKEIEKKSHEKYWSGKIKEVLADGDYEVAMDEVLGELAEKIDARAQVNIKDTAVSSIEAANLEGEVETQVSDQISARARRRRPPRGHGDLQRRLEHGEVGVEYEKSGSTFTANFDSARKALITAAEVSRDFSVEGRNLNVAPAYNFVSGVASVRVEPRALGRPSVELKLDSDDVGNRDALTGTLSIDHNINGKNSIKPTFDLNSGSATGLWTTNVKMPWGKPVGASVSFKRKFNL